MFPGYRIRAITNGVHVGTWTHESFARAYQARFPHWSHEPDVLVRADQIDDDTIWSAHMDAKRDLMTLVQARTGVTLEPDKPLFVFARRMTGYKRPTLLFSDLGRLIDIAKQMPFQLVFSGKAHPRDAEGKALIQQIGKFAQQLAGTIPIAFIANYDMEVAKALVSGGDVWLNTPLPPMEASGTSGMKAALNGVLNLSILDGWWIEACIEGTNGWAIGDDHAGGPDDHDAVALYDKLEQVVLPLYYNDRARWTWMKKQAISKIAYYFNSHRMMRRYATEAYIR
jgi:starch phosphorylase